MVVLPSPPPLLCPCHRCQVLWFSCPARFMVFVPRNRQLFQINGLLQYIKCVIFLCVLINRYEKNISAYFVFLSRLNLEFSKQLPAQLIGSVIYKHIRLGRVRC